MTKAIFAGSFDPPTLGHLDLIKRSLRIVDQVVVALGENPAKKSLFSVDERCQMLNSMISDQLDFLDSTRVKVGSFSSMLLVDYARHLEAQVLIRGIRGVTDFEYETTLANINKTLAPNIETIFLPTDPALSIVSSSAVKEIARYGGDLARFVAPTVARAIEEKMGRA